MALDPRLTPNHWAIISITLKFISVFVNYYLYSKDVMKLRDRNWNYRLSEMKTYP